MAEAARDPVPQTIGHPQGAAAWTAQRPLGCGTSVGNSREGLRSQEGFPPPPSLCTFQRKKTKPANPCSALRMFLGRFHGNLWPASFWLKVFKPGASSPHPKGWL